MSYFCSTEYQSECETLQEEHDVEDDVVSCETVVEEKCEDETSGYTTNTKCSKWPREVCSVQRTPVKKFTPETRCQKVPVELCGPSGKSYKLTTSQCNSQDAESAPVPKNVGWSCGRFRVRSRRSSAPSSPRGSAST